MATDRVLSEDVKKQVMSQAKEMVDLFTRPEIALSKEEAEKKDFWNTENP